MEIRSYKVTLESLEPFRIGALENPISGVHNPVTRIGGRVVVQGASLKGAFRAEIERHLIENFMNNSGMKPCIPSPANSLSGGERRLIEAGKYKRGGGCQYKEERKKGKETPAPLGQDDYVCPVCYLLGAQGLIGFVRVPYLFSDSIPEELYAVRIDRATSTVADGTNRDYQIIPPHVRFEGKLEVLISDLLLGWRLGQPRRLVESATKGDLWLAGNGWSPERILDELVVQRMHAIAFMGGFKSRGCGRVQIQVELNGETASESGKVP